MRTSPDWSNHLQASRQTYTSHFISSIWGHKSSFIIQRSCWWGEGLYFWLFARCYSLLQCRTVWSWSTSNQGSLATKYSSTTEGTEAWSRKERISFLPLVWSIFHQKDRSSLSTCPRLICLVFKEALLLDKWQISKGNKWWIVMASTLA